MRYLFVFALLILSGLSLPGCNTVEGMGKDVQRAGETIQGTAR